jgi:general secretion pathway protein I
VIGTGVTPRLPSGLGNWAGKARATPLPALRADSSNPPETSRRTSGFTLLEVVVALAVVGIGVTLGMQLFSGALKNIRKMELATHAMNHAENVMNEILSDENIKAARSMHDDLDENFRWEAVIEEFQIPEQSEWRSTQPFPMKLLNVRVDVIYKNDRYGKLYRLSCLKPVGLREPLAPGSPAPVNPFGNIQ